MQFSGDEDSFVKCIIGYVLTAGVTLDVETCLFKPAAQGLTETRSDPALVALLETQQKLVSDLSEQRASKGLDIGAPKVELGGPKTPTKIITPPACLVQSSRLGHPHSMAFEGGHSPVPMPVFEGPNRADETSPTRTNDEKDSMQPA